MNIREQMATNIAKVYGTDLNEVCGYSTDADECDSDTCPGALTEDHDADYQRERFMLSADAAISIFANPSDELVERCARVLHGHLYGYEGANPNSNPDDEDRHLVRAVLAAAVGEG